MSTNILGSRYSLHIFLSNAWKIQFEISSLFVLERTGPLISATVSRNKLNIDSTPRIYGLVRHEYVACAAERTDQD